MLHRRTVSPPQFHSVTESNMNEGQDRTVIQSFIRRVSRLISTTTRAVLFFSVKRTSGTPRYSSPPESDERPVVIAIER